MKLTRLLALVLALLMIVFTVACANDTPGDDDTPKETTPASQGGNDTPDDGGEQPSQGDQGDQGDSGETTPADTTPPAPELDEYGRPIVEADLPDVKYDNMTFTVHTRGNVEQYEWLAEDQTGDRLNDAIYERNTAIEEKYGIELVVVAQGNWSNYANETLPAVRASIMASTGSYDLIAGYSTPISNMVTEGLLYDLNELEHLDFDKPWWWQNFREASVIGDANYYGLGALSLSAIYSMSCVFFNPSMLEQTNPGTDLYQLVLDGKWTWDKMTELASNANDDLDGNSVMDVSDRFGMVIMSNGNPVNQYMVGTGEMLSSRKTDGTPELNVNKENMSTAIDNLIKLFHQNEACFVGAQNDVRKMFIDGKALFHSEWLYYAQTQIAGQVEKYGLVPTPKQNEAQEDYSTWIQSGMHIYCIPVDVKDVERASILTEAFAAESYKSLLPQYYEVVLKARYFKDEASSQMMDIMYDSVSFDFARIFDGQIGILSAINGSVTGKQNVFSSAWTTASKVSAKKLEQMLTKVAANAK